MYLLILTLLIVLGAAVALHGHRRGRRGWIAAGVALIAATAAFFGLLDFWGEMLWFEAVGYSDRFWTVLGMEAGAIAGGAVLAYLAAGLVTLPIAGLAALRTGAMWLASAGGAVWGGESWREILLFLNRTPTELSEPILGLSTSFYLFVLPLLGSLFQLLIWIAAVGLVASLAAVAEVGRGNEVRVRQSAEAQASGLRPVAIASLALAAALAYGQALEAFYLLYSEWGVVAGPGWTDAHVRLPATGLVAVLIVLLGAAPLVPAFGRWFGRSFPNLRVLGSKRLAVVAGAWGAIAAAWFLGLQAAPGLTQWLLVEPNEITYEAPYIAHNIRFTRHGFRLDEVEERQFPATGRFSREMAKESEHLLSEIRLWDWRALDAVYRQFQEIRLYYAYHDVDIDRYDLDGRYRLVMTSAREMAQDNLPAQSQTFVNRRFKYTHGYGVTLTPASEFTPNGLPNLLVKDIPPQSEVPGLEVERPQIYYGELTRGPVVVNTREAEFDYPRGDQNAYIRYPGSGGVALEGLWRKFLFGWKFDGTRFLLSTYPKPESRIQFHRQVRERVATLAPFLELDEDPYVVLAGGRLYWIIDAYTTSEHFPYSEPFAAGGAASYREGGGPLARRTRVLSDLEGANYVRNSVKVVVDAFDGTVDFYVFEPEDPIVRTWAKALPGFFKERAAMPPGLRAHVRYPVGMLLTQGLIYAKYHMDDPAVFYNQEDLWVRATEKYYGHTQPVQPYYIMWQLPGSEEPEFVLMMPFTPKNRQVLIGWIAGLCDGENYGRFLAYKFPKERRVLGPQQVETKIDQDRHLSGQLTLWDQRGSKVIRGNVLAIPIDDTLLYVEPIYLEAETAAYPELRLVVLMHGDTLSYAQSFDEALQGLFEGEPPAFEAEAVPEGDRRGLARRANQAFERYLEHLGEQRFDEAAGELKTLRDLLQRLAGGEGQPEP